MNKTVVTTTKAVDGVDVGPFQHFSKLIQVKLGAHLFNEAAYMEIQVNLSNQLL